MAFGLSWLASPPARTWAHSFVTKGTLFAAALMSELFVLMMAVSISARLPWKTHVAKIAQGLGVYSLISLLIETGHSYFGVGRDVRAFVFLSHIRIASYLICVAYWAVMLWRKEQLSREMSAEMRQRLFTLQRRVEYDLSKLAITEKIVTTHKFHFLSAIGIFLILLLSIAGYYLVRGRRSPQASWEDLVRKLTWIDRNIIAQVALDLVDE